MATQQEELEHHINVALGARQAQLLATVEEARAAAQADIDSKTSALNRVADEMEGFRTGITPPWLQDGRGGLYRSSTAAEFAGQAAAMDAAESARGAEAASESSRLVLMGLAAAAYWFFIHRRSRRST